MGLDWMLRGRMPRAGHEKQYHRINNKLAALGADAGEHERDELELALKSVSMSPYDVIGAPRVGIDADATAWFRREVYVPIQLQLPQSKNPQFIAYWRRAFEAVVQDECGKYVVELAKDPEGVASITGMLTGALDFRGKVVGQAECIDHELKNEAYDDHSSEECLDYADRLEAALVGVGERHRHGRTDITAAVKWLRYWGAKGFGFAAWY